MRALPGPKPVQGGPRAAHGAGNGLIPRVNGLLGALNGLIKQHQTAQLGVKDSQMN